MTLCVVTEYTLWNTFNCNVQWLASSPDHLKNQFFQTGLETRVVQWYEVKIEGSRKLAVAGTRTLPEPITIKLHNMLTELCFDRLPRL